jgi:hypothetical protein
VILSSASTLSLKVLGRDQQVNECRRLDWSSLFDQPGSWEPCRKGHESNDSERPGRAKAGYQAIHGEANGCSSYPTTRVYNAISKPTLPAEVLCRCHRYNLTVVNEVSKCGGRKEIIP